jgi:hypothetical protein
VPPPFWLEPAIVVDMLAGCSWVVAALSKIACSAISVMVGRT